ncbi:MAG: ornithine cyclodeaminase family protein [Rubrivivax sp.]|nr:ornithine cyclodeaminase family protein [Pyrinomonadaceae bacterium]
MDAKGTLLLKRNEVAALLGIEECMAAVEEVFKFYAEGKTAPPGVLGLHAREGGFHIKAALLDRVGKTYFAAKTNANFPQNVERFGLPLIQGVIVLCDAESGYPLALMDSTEITITRTGAATGVAAKYLARGDASVAAAFGCGNQGKISLRALARVRSLERVFAYDKDAAQAKRFAAELSGELGVEVEAAGDPASAARRSDICITCTPAKQFFLKREDIRPGTFIAAVGADSPEKQELEPELLRGNKIVTDITEQCATIGELHHAIEAGLVTRADVHAELGDVIAGRRPGRTSPDEIIIFDSTGTALQDVVAAAIVYERAVSAGAGIRLNFTA